MDYLLLRLLSFILLGLPNIVGHTFGCYVLYFVYKNREPKILPLYISSLSFAEVLWNIAISLDLLLEYLGHQNARNFVIILSTCFAGVVYMSYLYITLNRFLEVVLNLRYPIYWNEHKAKVLIFVTWIVCLLFSTLMTLLSLKTSFGYVRVLRIHLTYVAAPAKVLFLLIVIPIYIFLFLKFRKCRIGPTTLADVPPQPSLWSTFRHSTFYTAVLLTFSYAFFMVVPTYVIRHHLHTSSYTSTHIDRRKLLVRLLFDLVVRLCCLLDVWIYVSTEKHVRQKFWKVLRRCVWWRDAKIDSTSSTHSSAATYVSDSYT